MKQWWALYVFLYSYVMPWDNSCGWYRGVIPCNVLGQWLVTPWGNGSWCRGAMAGDAFIWWFFRFFFIWASVGQMTEKDPNDYLTKFAATLGNYHVLINYLFYSFNFHVMMDNISIINANVWPEHLKIRVLDLRSIFCLFVFTFLRPYLIGPSTIIPSKCRMYATYKWGTWCIMTHENARLLTSIFFTF